MNKGTCPRAFARPRSRSRENRMTQFEWRLHALLTPRTPKHRDMFTTSPPLRIAVKRRRSVITCRVAHRQQMPTCFESCVLSHAAYDKRSRPFMGAQLPPSGVGEPTPLKVVLGFRLLKSLTPGTGAQDLNDTPKLLRVNRYDSESFYMCIWPRDR